MDHKIWGQETRKLWCWLRCLSKGYLVKQQQVIPFCRVPGTLGSLGHGRPGSLVWFPLICRQPSTFYLHWAEWKPHLYHPFTCSFCYFASCLFLWKTFTFLHCHHVFRIHILSGSTWMSKQVCSFKGRWKCREGPHSFSLRALRFLVKPHLGNIDRDYCVYFLFPVAYSCLFL